MRVYSNTKHLFILLLPDSEFRPLHADCAHNSSVLPAVVRASDGACGFSIDSKALGLPRKQQGREGRMGEQRDPQVRMQLGEERSVEQRFEDRSEDPYFGPKYYSMFLPLYNELTTRRSINPCFCHANATCTLSGGQEFNVTTPGKAGQVIWHYRLRSCSPKGAEKGLGNKGLADFSRDQYYFR